MNRNQLQEGLQRAFEQENHRLVFWYDAEQAFTDQLSLLSLADVQILNMAHHSALGVKLKLEREDQTGKYLLYFPFAEPDIEQDWLLDIKLYSRCFYADRFSIIFNELGLEQHSLREHLAKRDKFLASKARLSALQRYIQPHIDAQALDLAMIATVLKAESSDLTHLIFALAEHSVQEHVGLEDNPSVLGELEKYDLMPALLYALQTELGYQPIPVQHPDEPPLKLGQFLIRLLITAFCEQVGTVPDWAQALRWSSGGSRTIAFLSRWRDSARYYPTFDVISTQVAEAVHLSTKISTFELQALTEVMIFEVVEQHIILELVDAIPRAATHELEHFCAVIATRRDGYWASKHNADDTRRKFRNIYTALQTAIELFDLRAKHQSGFHFVSCAELYQAYQQDLYRFDSAYRQYCAASRRAKVEVLKPLDRQVGDCYAYWYLDNLAKNWGDRLESEQRLQDWRLPNVPNQQHFFQKHVWPLLSAPQKRRVVVIISDAFRYEAAVELCHRINDKRYCEATLSSQLGVVPSYTTLGMAALLPHQSLEYKPSVVDDVFVDGLSSKGTVARNKILSAHGGLAVTAEEVKSWSRDEGREILKEQQLVYVYHNIIDDRSDKGGISESDTFEHVEAAIDDLTELSRKILMHFNTSTVLITADHGFLFQQNSLEDADRTAIAEKPTNTLKYKKRYVVGFDLPDTREAWKGSTQATAGTVSATDFWIPKGANRFHFVGGARFVHGGAMPQEIVVPVLTVKQLRGEKAEKRTKRKVGVISAKSTLRIVNRIQKIELMQTEAVSELVVPITVTVAIYDADQKVSSEETITFDGVTDSMTERAKAVRVSLMGTGFDRKKDYFLVIKDKDLNTEIERYKVSIDLMFTDDLF